MGYVDDAFLNLKGKLEITVAESASAIRGHLEIRDHVRESWELQDDFLTGSYRRDTKTKPLKDVDIFIVIDGDGAQAQLRKSDPKAILDKLSLLLSNKYADVCIDRMSCKVNIGSGDEIMSFDVVPAFQRAKDEFEIPDARTGTWITTNPKRHHELSTDKNKACDGKYVPFAKMVKAINRELGDPVDPSFLIEVMALDYVKEQFGTYQDEVRWFLASAKDGVKNIWPDPAGLGPNVNSMSTDRQAKAASALGHALEIAEQAIRLEDDGQERAAVEEWRRLFGWRMPRP
jgi:hypothetical protein